MRWSGRKRTRRRWQSLFADRPAHDYISLINPRPCFYSGNFINLRSVACNKNILKGLNTQMVVFKLNLCENSCLFKGTTGLVVVSNEVMNWVYLAYTIEKTDCGPFIVQTFRIIAVIRHSSLRAFVPVCLLYEQMTVTRTYIPSSTLAKFDMKYLGNRVNNH